MSNFTDTANWKRKDATTLVYSYDRKGERHEGSCEMEPQTVAMQLQRLSVLNEISWRIKDEKDPEREADFFSREYITALGILDDCRLHAITLDDKPNETSSRINVTIHPVPLEKLQATSVIDSWSLFREKEKPAEGWLRNEIGRIRYHSAGEYHDGSMFSASVLISQEKFDALALAVKQGNIRSARLSLLADLYHFGYESMGAGIRGHYYNYAILCEDDGASALSGSPKGSDGTTKARLQELIVEWSPKLDAKMAGLRDEPDEGDHLEPDMVQVERDLDTVVARLSKDVRAIRGRVDLFYQAVILGVILLVLGQVLDWFTG
ncbi:hypothetical protein [Roseicyclus marinus]|uniref:hypothetical protein n=1 Tax=Roseicyclus marinus TaxID=2161673 RepID=UPI00240FF36C|nr:hypothetical protein [Roseicyclus marinus]MDG3039856.1 hypothetical protein [Roseicyclus marinus]